MGARPYNTLLLVLSVLFLITLSNVVEGRYTNLPLKACKPRCTYRCSATSHKKPCMLYCQKCCATCRCVPPGVYGHKEICPCYNNWKTKEGRPKCP
ncbi:hypothetical protein SASPL_145048 [Salvia splendens]|uniref:Gibberellin regulated protein n=1 Tax=Salvia splendens TaxID=180675 RepID=A0A8X8WGD9_SALSN|nr:protein RSI-1-like [Salvia splendens]KAG6394463.1 hypothetical protein SASPL_145048 [Salvia splendens]